MSKQLFKDYLINFLRGEAVKFALKKILGSAALGGFKAWVISVIVKHFYDEVAEPLIEYGLRKAGYIYNKVEGKILIKKLEGAKNEDEYDDVITDILS